MKEESKQLMSSLVQYESIMTIIKGSPDPDAIASSYAVNKICEKLGVKNSIFSEKKLSLPQNKALVDKLDIPIRFKIPDDVSTYDSYMIFDHQSARVEIISEKLPCAVHIDHHENMDDTVECTFRLIRTDSGSTSTLIALLLQELDHELEAHTMKKICTALMYGIETDTDHYAHAGDLDYRAIEFLSRFSDSSVIKKINGIALSKETVTLLWKALENLQIYKDWLITGIGFVKESNRDSIAIIADFILKREDSPTVVVFAAIEQEKRRGLTLDASFRSIDENTNLNGIIKEITANGGGRKYKGAFQIDMDFFSHCPDKEILWNMINITTIAALKKSRDSIYITEIARYYNKLKFRLSQLIKK